MRCMSRPMLAKADLQGDKGAAEPNPSLSLGALLIGRMALGRKLLFALLVSPAILSINGQARQKHRRHAQQSSGLAR